MACVLHNENVEKENIFVEWWQKIIENRLVGIYVLWCMRVKLVGGKILHIAKRVWGNTLAVLC